MGVKMPGIMSYNGGAVIAMKGKNCFAIASDLRFGVQAQTVGFNFEKIFPMSDQLYIGLSGLATDIQTVQERLNFQIKLYELRENRKIGPKQFLSVVSNLLYDMCEVLWKPNMSPDELFECCAQALLNSVDRDASSGWGAVVHIVEQDKVTTKKLKARMD